VYHLNGEFYSTGNAAKLVRVEIPAPYTNLRGLLRSMDRALRTHHSKRPVPIISYDRTYPISARRYSNDNTTERAQVILEPASTPRKKSSHRHRSSKHKLQRYSTVVVDTDDAVDSAYEYDNDGEDYSVKAPLYERETQRRRENYRVEIREPSFEPSRPAERESSSRRRKREGREGASFWD
jgi:hypothetical protein